MAWYWPTIEDESSAEHATKAAVGVSGFIAAITALLAVLSIIYHKPIFGLDGLGLIDAAIFALIAWRISKVSRTWAVVGLLMYLGAPAGSSRTYPCNCKPCSRSRSAATGRDLATEACEALQVVSHRPLDELGGAATSSQPDNQQATVWL